MEEFSVLSFQFSDDQLSALNSQPSAGLKTENSKLKTVR